ncbi:MAG TPA: acyl-CoA dehydrogenase family protein [Polyangiales bacterium]|nr:acyl-CoA dehydrogenase family protein [Polyangiales bacterium]
MLEWSEQHLAFRDALRRFIDAQIRPRIDEFEHEGVPPYDVLRKLLATFGIAEMQRARFEARIARDEASERGESPAKVERKSTGPDDGAADMVALGMMPTIELARVAPGMVTAMGVSIGLTTGTINSRGTIAQRKRFVPPLLGMDKIGAWAITEPGSGSDAFGAMRSTARRDGEGYVLNGSKTFITNGPYADTIVFICKLDDGTAPPDKRQVLSFILDKGMPGLTQSKPLRKMGQHSSPTGELFLEDVRVDRDRLLGENEQKSYRSGARDTFSSERSGTSSIALGIVEECLKLSVAYAKTRVQFGRPIGEFQLIQQKLAKMEVARMNIQNIVFRSIELARHGKSMTFAEASACKLYSAQAAMEVALEAVQLFGGNGYMAEFRVEQLCRDAKVLQIYGGTDEIQTSQVARDLLAR